MSTDAWITSRLSNHHIALTTMDDLEECVQVAQRINDRTSSLAKRRKTFEKTVLSRLGDLTGRIIRWNSAPSGTVGESKSRRLEDPVAFSAETRSGAREVAGERRPQGERRAQSEELRDEPSFVNNCGQHKKASSSSNHLGQVGSSSQLPLHTGGSPERTRKRSLDTLESPSPPPRRTIKPFPPRRFPSGATSSSSTALQATASSPAAPSSSAPESQRRKSNRPPKTPQRFASVHTWSASAPDHRRQPSSTSRNKRRSSTTNTGSIQYTASGAIRQRRRLRQVRSRPEGVMAPSDGRTRILGAVWPKKRENTVRGIAQIVVCDSCAGGAHFACAGIDDDKDMLDEEWICPDCVCMRKLDFQARLSPCAGRCIRSNCVLREKQAIIHKQEDYLEYVIDRIIGQRPDPEADGNMEYLVKWDGVEWTIKDSTWEPQENLRDILIAKQMDFHSACLQAGIHIKVDSKDFVLLPEAAEFFGEDGKLKAGHEGWSKYVESEDSSRSSSIVPL